MASLAALILTDNIGALRTTAPEVGNMTVAGLTLTERAALAAHGAGVDDIHLVGECLPDERVLARLRARGLSIVCRRARVAPFEEAPSDTLLLVLPAATMVEPAAITTLLEQARLRAGEAVLVVDEQPDARHRFLRVADGKIREFMTDGNAAATGLALLTPEAVEIVRHAPSAWAAFGRLARATTFWAITVAPHFCERLHDPQQAAGLERRYVRRPNGDEFSFTKVMRRRFVHLARLLLCTQASRTARLRRGTGLPVSVALSVVNGPRS